MSGNNKSIAQCTICESRHLHYAFTLETHRIVRCDNCGYITINPQPSDEVLWKMSGTGSFDSLPSAKPDELGSMRDMQQANMEKYVKLVSADRARTGGALLVIGCDDDSLSIPFVIRELDVSQIIVIPYTCGAAFKVMGDSQDNIVYGEAEIMARWGGHFDYVICVDVLGSARDPRVLLRIISRLLKSDARALFVEPSLDSWPAKLLRTNWKEFKLERISYFDTKNLRSLLFQEGLSEIKYFNAQTSLDIRGNISLVNKNTMSLYDRLKCWSRRWCILGWLSNRFLIGFSGIGIMVKKRRNPGDLLLSVIMPAYNECSTVKDGIERVLAKTLHDMDIELILVESNSQDGTRDVVLEYVRHPFVTVILEDEPLGKGHAVRKGLKVANGDFVLIQDADDEYDIDDYDALIERLRDGREGFVLGARHGGGAWKMRKFSDQPVKAFILNIGHWIFTMAVNVCYGVWLKDPFTMYKVFRRDCIEGIHFECNRFDFDYELLIKLIRKGYKPVEIPVNYRSRSFLQGKKVRMFADPVTWIKAIVKYRFVKI